MSPVPLLFSLTLGEAGVLVARPGIIFPVACVGSLLAHICRFIRLRSRSHLHLHGEAGGNRGRLIEGSKEALM